MDQKKLIELRKRAFQKINKIRFLTKEDREDFAQDFVMRYLEGKSQKQPIKFAIVDYIRRNHPLSRVKGGRKPNDLDNFKKKEIEDNVFPDPAYTTNRVVNRMDAVKMLSYMEREDRVLFILRFYFDFSFPELSLIFGISENALQKKIKQIEDYIS